MEHGLGDTVLRKFVEGIGIQLESEAAKIELKEVLGEVEPTLRSSDDENAFPFFLYLEKNVEKGFTDLVIRIGHWWLSMENKIYGSSVSHDKNQVRLQYEGLRNHLDTSPALGAQHRIVSIFIAPSDSSKAVQAELDAVRQVLHQGDFATCVLWQSSGDTLPEIGGYVSIVDIISDVLREESMGNIEPISEYLRHTLKAFIKFLKNDFSGYRYARPVGVGSMNQKALGRFAVKQLKNKNLGYVGVSGGLSGLLRYDVHELEAHEFQYATDDMSAERNWLPLEDFNKLASWLLGGPPPEFHWDGVYSADSLLRIAEAYPQVYIGIRGGEAGLRNLSTSEIAGKRWGVSEVRKSPQWISAGKYREILSAHKEEAEG
jgi:hypothetical protein